jgi:hypothetical protein
VLVSFSILISGVPAEMGDFDIDCVLDFGGMLTDILDGVATGLTLGNFMPEFIDECELGTSYFCT